MYVFVRYVHWRAGMIRNRVGHGLRFSVKKEMRVDKKNVKG